MKYYVVFYPGSYGTYLAWAMYTFSELNITKEIIPPFALGGSAHNYRMQQGIKYVEPVHVVPKDSQNLVLVKPLYNDLVEYLDNQLVKQLENNNEDLIVKILPDVKEKLLHNWQSASPARWELRELLSYFLPDMCNNVANTYNKDFDNYNGIQINPNDIISSIKKVLGEIYDFFGLKPIDTIDKLEEIHNIYCGMQKNLSKVAVIENYVNATIENINLSLDNLTLFDEAWIQHRLRQNNFVLRCTDLNLFPKYTKELTKLIYKN
jgi:hypothetical protein